jgi:hypothetical protein
MVSPFALLAAVPLLPAPLWLRDRVMDRVELAAYDVPAGGGSPAIPDVLAEDAAAAPEVAVAAVAAGKTPRRGRLRVAAAAAAVFALLAAGGAVAYLRNAPVPGEPLGLDFPVAPTLPTSTAGSDQPSSAASKARPSSATATATTTDDEPTPDDDTTTTTTRRPGPPTPPDRPDPPRDTTPPELGASAANPRLNTTGCREPFTSLVSATASDDRGVTSVTLSWSGAGSSGGGMSPGPNGWSGSIGPFSEPGGVEWTVTASDAAGNQSSTTGKITVSGCAGPAG